MDAIRERRIGVLLLCGDENHSTFELSLAAIYHHNKDRNSLAQSLGTMRYGRGAMIRSRQSVGRSAGGRD